MQFKFANNAWMAQNKKLAEIRNNFPLTEHRIENVKISAGDLTIAMKGGANVIKNNIIKVTDGSTASIYLFGPNQLIENNIIIFKGKPAHQTQVQHLLKFTQQMAPLSVTTPSS